MERTSRRVKFVTIPRWYIFHDGHHNWDQQTALHPYNQEYVLRQCVKCGNIIKEDLQEFYGQGTVCERPCKCEDENDI